MIQSYDNRHTQCQLYTCGRCNPEYHVEFVTAASKVVVKVRRVRQDVMPAIIENFLEKNVQKAIYPLYFSLQNGIDDTRNLI